MRNFFTFFLLLICLNASASVPYILEKEFKLCLNRNYSEKEFLKFYKVLDSLNDKTNIQEFKTYSSYTGNINKLINSFNVYQKGIAYKLVATLNDQDFKNLLIERLSGEENKFLKTLNAAAVMQLAPKQTTLAFDFLVDCDNFANSPLLPVYLSMDSASIVKTAFLRLNDKRVKGKVFALQTLARFDADSTVDSIIIKCLHDWDISIKGYAIVALRIHRKRNFKDILSPYVNELELRDVILETLEKSYSGADVRFAEQLKRKRH